MALHQRQINVGDVDSTLKQRDVTCTRRNVHLILKHFISSTTPVRHVLLTMGIFSEYINKVITKMSAFKC